VRLLHGPALWRSKVIAEGEFGCNLAESVSLEKRTNTLVTLAGRTADPLLPGACNVAIL